MLSSATKNQCKQETVLPHDSKLITVDISSAKQVSLLRESSAPKGAWLMFESNTAQHIPVKP